MIAFTLDKILKIIDSQTVLKNLNQPKKLLDILETILDKTRNDKRNKLEAIGILGVCLSLVDEENCKLSQLKKFFQYSKYSWLFNPGEFNSNFSKMISPLEFVIQYSHRQDVINLILSSIPDNLEINDTFFNGDIYDTLDMDRKKNFITSKFININHQHSSQHPSLILNKVLWDKNDNYISELEMLLSLGADPKLTGKASNLNFIKLARLKLNNNQYLQLILKLNHITSFHLLLYMYETFIEFYPYEGLPVSFYLYYKYRDDINFQDVIRYIKILFRLNFGNEYKDKYQDTYIYLQYLLSKAKTINNNESLTEISNEIDKTFPDLITKDLETLINLRTKQNLSKYRTYPVLLPQQPILHHAP